MIYMLSRNKVADFEKWNRGFASHAEAHRAAEIKLIHVWRDINDPNNVFIVFEVGSIEKARAFIDAPEAAEAGKEFGVVEGEYHFVEASEIYQLNHSQ